MFQKPTITVGKFSIQAVAVHDKEHIEKVLYQKIIYSHKYYFYYNFIGEYQINMDLLSNLWDQN